MAKCTITFEVTDEPTTIEDLEEMMEKMLDLREYLDGIIKKIHEAEMRLKDG